MKFKNAFFIICLIICLFSISSVGASEIINETSDFVSIENEDSSIELTSNDKITNEYSTNNNIIDNLSNNDYDVFVNDEKEKINKDILGTSNITEGGLGEKYYTDYYAVISNVSILKGSSMAVKINLYSHLDTYFSYDFNLKLCDKKGNVVMTSDTYSKSNAYKTAAIAYPIDSSKLPADVYTLKLFTTTGHLISTGIVAIISNKYPKYNINIKDTSIPSISGGIINMTVVQNKDAPFNAYDFTLKIKDSKKNVILSKGYKASDCNPSEQLSYTIDPYKLPVGEYDIELATKLNSNEWYIINGAKLRVTYDYKGYSVTLKDTTLNYGKMEKVYAVVSLNSENPADKCKINLFIYDLSNNLEMRKSYEGTVSSTISWTINTTSLKVGKHIAKLISYDGETLATANLIIKDTSNINPDAENTPNSYSVKLDDCSIRYGSKIDFPLLIKPDTVGKPYTYNFNVTIFNSNGVAKVHRVHYKNTTKIVMGNSTFKTILPPGEYIAKVINNEDHNILDTANLTIKYSTDYSINVKDTIIETGPNGTIPILINPLSSVIYCNFYVNIFDSNNVKIIEDIYHKKINGTRNLNFTINSADLSPGIYTIKVINVEDDKTLSTAILTVKKVTTPTNIISSIPTKLISSDVTTIYKNKKYLVVTLKDDNNNVIKGANISINLKGIKQLHTDENGQAKLPIVSLIPKDYTAIITFKGNNNYEKSTAKAQITVKKATPKIIAGKKTYKQKVKIKKYVITLKDNKNKVIKNAKVLLNVKGKTYSVKTNSKGQAAFKITHLTKIGTFKATITYKGNLYYNKIVKKNVKIMVKK